MTLTYLLKVLRGYANKFIFWNKTFYNSIIQAVISKYLLNAI